MGKKRKQLSQVQVWDDSALLQSWDDALTEYKLYHSIHACGERVEDVIKDDEAESHVLPITQDSSRQVVAGMQNNSTSPEKLEDREQEEEPESAQTYPKGDSKENFQGSSTIEPEHKQPPANARTTVDQLEKAEIPSAFIDGVKDENLKNLMMSWYYAGYYTGLYEGQQQVQRHTSKQET